MKKVFFIYSLPRSGSSWLSVFLSSPGSYCYHEPLADVSLENLEAKILSRPEDCVGAIDTSAYQRTGLIFNSRVNRYVLLREPSELARSLRMRGWVLDVESERDKLIAAAQGALPILYKSLWSIDYLADVWDAIVGTPFDRERAQYLTEMNIQRKFASVKERFDLNRMVC